MFCIKSVSMGMCAGCEHCAFDKHLLLEQAKCGSMV